MTIPLSRELWGIFIFRKAESLKHNAEGLAINIRKSAANFFHVIRRHI
jgi:hypothetical protein